MDVHSHIGNAAYLDLLRMKKDEAVSDTRDAVVRHAHGDKGNLYDEFRVGTDLIRKYSGEDTPTAREKLCEAEEIRANVKASQARDRQLVCVLRAEGYAGVEAAAGSLLMNLARTGVFGLGGTIVGTVAFRPYEGELGVRIGGSNLAQTGDMDIASFQRLVMVIDDVVESRFRRPCQTSSSRRCRQWTR